MMVQTLYIDIDHLKVQCPPLDMMMMMKAQHVGDDVSSRYVKEWLWEHKRDEIMSAMKIDYTPVDDGQDDSSTDQSTTDSNVTTTTTSTTELHQHPVPPSSDGVQAATRNATTPTPDATTTPMSRTKSSRQSPISVVRQTTDAVDVAEQVVGLPSLVTTTTTTSTNHQHDQPQQHQEDHHHHHHHHHHHAHIRPVSTNRRASMSLATTVQAEASMACRNNTQQKMFLLDTIARIQKQFLQSEKENVVFQYALDGLLDLASSEFGFIAQVKHDPDGTQYMIIKALSNVAWNPETEEFYTRHLHQGMKFYDLDNLFGLVVTAKTVIMSNDLSRDPRAAGLPPGHPAVTKFLGIPFFEHGSQNIVGMVGIANTRRVGGYCQEDVIFLEPFVSTCCNLIQAYEFAQENKRLISSLEKIVEERTAAYQLLENANQKQLTHFACMSHEIRTPLNAVLGMTSLLRETTHLSYEQREYLKIITTSGELLNTVINDVLDFSRLESGKVDIFIEPTNLQDALDTIVEAMALKAQEKRLRFQTYYAPNVPKIIDTDLRRLQQILYNLLGNATKFSEEAGSVELSVEFGSPTERTTTADPNTSVIRFIVKDYGRGIDKKDFDTIFESFSQASGDTQRLYGGTGLGLSITARLVEALGGVISVDSVLGEWAKFTVELPVSAKSGSVGQENKTVSSTTNLNLDAISDHMRKTHVLYLSSEDDDQLGETLDYYHVNRNEFKDSTELETWLSSSASIKSLQEDREKFYFLLVHEDLYNHTWYERLKASTSACALVSFGPKNSVEDCGFHFRSLSQILPTVLMESLVSCMQQKPSVPSGQDTSSSSTFTKSNTQQDCACMKQIKALIAEDNLINQKVLKKMLNRLGMENIDIANNGKEAVDMSNAKEYSIIFMDMQMPIMDGLEACRIIVDRRLSKGISQFSQGASHGPRIVFVTAHALKDFEMKAIAAGADGFISKPFALAKIQDYLTKLCL